MTKICGLSLADAPFDRRRSDGLCFVGRVAPEKGIVDAMEIARRAGRPLRIAAKIGETPPERAYYEDVFRPALEAAGSEVEIRPFYEAADLADFVTPEELANARGGDRGKLGVA